MEQHEPNAGVVGEIGAPFDDLDQLLDATFERKQAIERGERDRIVGAVLIDFAPRVDRALEIGALMLVDVGGFRPQRRGELARNRCGTVLDGARRLVPRTELAGEREQLRERVVVGDIDAPRARERGKREIDRTAALSWISAISCIVTTWCAGSLMYSSLASRITTSFCHQSCSR